MNKARERFRTLKHPQKFQIEWHQTSWFVLDPDNESVKVPIDSAIVDVVRAKPGCVVGYIVSIQGLDIEIAKHLSRPALMALGVGAQVRRIAPPPRGMERVQLTEGGGRERYQP